MKEICALLVKLHIILSRMQRVNQHARHSIIQVGCPTCCYQVCALDHANVGTADLDYSSGRCHRNDDGLDSVSNHQPHDCLLNRLSRLRSKKTSKLCVAGLCAGNSLGTGEFPAQMASYTENVSI